MSDILPWFDYTWNFEYPVGVYRAVCGRLAGVPARLEQLLRGASGEALTRKPEGKWSALEHAGHLLILDEQLHYPRLEQYLCGETSLMAADLTNCATREADFNRQPAAGLLREFRAAREKMMRLLDPLSLSDAARVATHPRLKMPLRLVDLCTFCAAHDDHHIAIIRSQL